ncbi:MAG: hypothetical protein WBO77_00720 [Microgenomates group bacterium]
MGPDASIEQGITTANILEPVLSKEVVAETDKSEPITPAPIITETAQESDSTSSATSVENTELQELLTQKWQLYEKVRTLIASAEPATAQKYTEAIRRLHQLGTYDLISADIARPIAYLLSQRDIHPACYDAANQLLLRYGIVYDVEYVATLDPDAIASGNDWSQTVRASSEEAGEIVSDLIAVIERTARINPDTVDPVTTTVDKIREFQNDPSSANLAVISNDEGGERLVRYDIFNKNKPVATEKPVGSTPEAALIADASQVDASIQRLQVIVATDPEMLQLRKEFLASTGIPLVYRDNIPFVVLYRSIRPGFEEATVAQGYTNRGSMGIKREKLADLESQLASSEAGEMGGDKLAAYLVGRHVADSSYSALIPATMTYDYAKQFGELDDLILELTVPLDRVVPVTQVVKKEHFANATFFIEDEVAIVGKIEPEWVKFT